jgi:superfamily II DNA/RNA helicase
MLSAAMHHVPTSFLSRLKLLEILNSGAFASPIIVFVNQKKTADMVAKDLQRAGVSVTLSPDKHFFTQLLEL